MTLINTLSLAALGVDISRKYTVYSRFGLMEITHVRDVIFSKKRERERNRDLEEGKNRET